MADPSTDGVQMEQDPETPQLPTPEPLAGQGEDITANKDGGVLKAIRQEGVGEDGPMRGDTVYVHYVGTLLDGSQFDSSRSRGEKFSFKLGKGEVIKSWDIGVATMKRGEVAVLTCKPEYAYGKRQQNRIPANSTLVFEVELFDWAGEDVSEDKDGSIIKRTLKEGEGTENPTEDSTVQVHIVGRLGDRVFDERNVEFIIGECGDHNIVEGVEKGIKHMCVGEECRLLIKSKHAFGSQGNKEFNIEPDTPIVYDVTLATFEKAKEFWEMGAEEKITGAENAKVKGTTYFKSGKYKDALKHYKKVTEYLDYDQDFSDEQKSNTKSLLLAGHLNCAMMHIKLDDNVSAVHSCDKALEIDEANEKGLFRRGQARTSMRDFELAKLDFAKVLELDPNNKAAKNQFAICAHHIKQHKEKERRMYSNMFSKFAKQDYKQPRVPSPFSGTIDHFSDGKGGEKATGEGDTPDQTTENGDAEGNQTLETTEEKGGSGDATQVETAPPVVAQQEAMES